MDRDSALSKIMKCLALSKSANEHEAATALRQARALMEKYAVTDSELAALHASAEFARSGAFRKPAQWESLLARAVADAFGCDMLFYVGALSSGRASAWEFIGCGANPKIASYAFNVLLRQVKASRKNYIATALKRCKAASRAQRADLFCRGWIETATASLSPLIPSEEASQAIVAYMNHHHPDLTTLKTTKRKLPRRDVIANDFMAGRMSGRSATVRHGMESSGGNAFLPSSHGGAN